LQDLITTIPEELFFIRWNEGNYTQPECTTEWQQNIPHTDCGGGV
jgi:hypothetical protein